jgi:signal transduction histidine kinase
LELQLWVSTIASLSKIGKETVIQFIIQDITKRKNTELKLKQSEIKFREAYNHLNFYKDIFTHDINNIFQNIQSSVELFTLNVQGDINLDKDDELLEIIRDQVKRGTDLVSNIRRLSEIEDSKLVLNKFEIIEVIQELKNNLIKIYKKRKITIQIQCEYRKLFIKTNELLRVVFENLLINAIIHNQNPIIEITIKISKVFEDEIYYLKMEFIDNGIGILPEMKEKVFQRGYSEKKDKMGLGLGLTLVKKIIENYNGQIWVEDRVEGDYTKGSNFILLIPEVN